MLVKLERGATVAQLLVECERIHAELGQPAHGVRQQVDADAERFDLGRRFEHAAGHSGAMQRKRERQPADAAADDENVRTGRVHRMPIVSANGRELSGRRIC